ncbi:hypothetical protein TNCV_391231 [Trichonephila clavipes]|nr:hypothetical protein TNCV_391231 [Trichonephila clavipes]
MYISLIKLVLEYASSIWVHASKTTLVKLECVQARAAKVIVWAVPCANNLKVVKECGLNSLDKRRCNLIKFANKVRSREPTHIARSTFGTYKSNAGSKISSPMLFDNEIRISLGLEHNKFSIYQEPLFSAGRPKNTIVTSLLEPCTKREPTNVIKAKGFKTIDKYPQDDFVFTYTDGSSDETFLNGDLGVFMTTPCHASYQQVIGVGAIVSCFTCELR